MRHLPSDVKWVQDYVLGILPNPLLWEVMAGDMNGDDLITTFDAQIMSRCVNGLRTYYHPTGYHGVSAHTPVNPASTPTWIGNNPDEPVSPLGISLSNFPKSVTTSVAPVNKLNAHFWGVGKGQ
ncbi:MAG: hypothetical protein R2792_01350 [Saprospiraceae bacterium]